MQSEVEVWGIRGSRSCGKQRGGRVGAVPLPVGFACSRTGFDSLALPLPCCVILLHESFHLSKSQIPLVNNPDLTGICRIK